MCQEINEIWNKKIEIRSGVLVVNKSYSLQGNIQAYYLIFPDSHLMLSFFIIHLKLIQNAPGNSQDKLTIDFTKIIYNP